MSADDKTPIVCWMATKALPPTLRAAERTALDELVTFLRQRFGPRVHDLRLFGSRARGEGHEFSDLDVLIAIDDLDSLERGEIWAFSGRMMDRHQVDVGAFTLPTARWRQLQQRGRLIAREIERDGIDL